MKTGGKKTTMKRSREGMKTGDMKTLSLVYITDRRLSIFIRSLSALSKVQTYSTNLSAVAMVAGEEALQNGGSHHKYIHQSPPDNCDDPLNWRKTAEALQGSHFDSLRQMVGRFRRLDPVTLQGQGLQVADVVAVARRRSDGVSVMLDAAAAKPRVESSAAWVAAQSCKGTDTYGVTTGFGATSHRRTNQGAELQRELIRFLDA